MQIFIYRKSYSEFNWISNLLSTELKINLHLFPYSCSNSQFHRMLKTVVARFIPPPKHTHIHFQFASDVIGITLHECKSPWQQSQCFYCTDGPLKSPCWTLRSTSHQPAFSFFGLTKCMLPLTPVNQYNVSIGIHCKNSYSALYCRLLWKPWRNMRILNKRGTWATSLTWEKLNSSNQWTHLIIS